MADIPKTSITELNTNNLKDVLTDWGEAEYRAKQILDWVWLKPITEFSSMTNLSPALRERLKEEFVLQSLEPVEQMESKDRKTTKILFKLHDGHTIESVLMRYNKRRTICVSSQVGCAFGCPLCATGASGFERNLTAAEIIDQVLFFSRQLRAKDQMVSNVVFMGMGEPMVNFEAVWQAIEHLTDPKLLGLGARHITISTSGIAPGIKKLGQKKLQVGLAVSLHASNDKLRDQMVPPNTMYPLEILLSACREYVEMTNRRISFEYAIIRDVNDSTQIAIELANLLRGLNCFVNIIPVNPSEHIDFLPPPKAKIEYFSQLLARHHVPNTVRMRRGTDIAAGCGQLRSRLQDIL